MAAHDPGSRSAVPLASPEQNQVKQKRKPQQPQPRPSPVVTLSTLSSRLAAWRDKLRKIEVNDHSEVSDVLNDLLFSTDRLTSRTRYELASHISSPEQCGRESAASADLHENLRGLAGKLNEDLLLLDEFALLMLCAYDGWNLVTMKGALIGKTARLGQEPSYTTSTAIPKIWVPEHSCDPAGPQELLHVMVTLQRCIVEMWGKLLSIATAAHEAGLC